MYNAFGLHLGQQLLEVAFDINDTVAKGAVSKMDACQYICGHLASTEVQQKVENLQYHGECIAKKKTFCKHQKEAKPGFTIFN